MSKKDYSGTISYCCSILGVSRSGYYHYLKTATAGAKREKYDLKVRAIILFIIWATMHNTKNLVL